MTKSITFTGKASAWLTCPWQRTDEVLEMVSDGKVEQALNELTFSNMDMSDVENWVQAGVAEITVTLSEPEVLHERQLAGLHNQLAKVRASNHARESEILDRISKLQALTYTGEQND